MANIIEDASFPSINRSLITIELKQPYVDWINSLREEEELKKEIFYTTENINDELTSYLIPEVLDPQDLEFYLEHAWILLFELQLSGWSLDEKQWPKKRTKKMFNEWFEIKCGTLVIDLWGRDPLEHQ